MRCDITRARLKFIGVRGLQIYAWISNLQIGQLGNRRNTQVTRANAKKLIIGMHLIFSNVKTAAEKVL